MLFQVSPLVLETNNVIVSENWRPMEVTDLMVSVGSSLEERWQLPLDRMENCCSTEL